MDKEAKKPSVTSIFIAALAGTGVAVFYQGFSLHQVFDMFYGGYAYLWLHRDWNEG